MLIKIFYWIFITLSSAVGIFAIYVNVQEILDIKDGTSLFLQMSSLPEHKMIPYLLVWIGILLINVLLGWYFVFKKKKVGASIIFILLWVVISLHLLVDSFFRITDI